MLGSSNVEMRKWSIFRWTFDVSKFCSSSRFLFQKDGTSNSAICFQDANTNFHWCFVPQHGLFIKSIVWNLESFGNPTSNYRISFRPRNSYASLLNSIQEQPSRKDNIYYEPNPTIPTTHLPFFPSSSFLPSPPQRSTKEKNWHRKYFHSKVLMQKKFNSTLFHHQAQKCRHFTASLVKPSDEKTSRLSRKSKFMSQRFFYSRTSRRNDENKFITYGKNWVCDKSERFFKRLW
jgi:hypothetical protein